MSYYDLVTVNQNRARYEELIPRWWNWVYEEDRDKHSDKGDVTFLRGDIVGGPPTESDENKQEIERKAGVNLFFPVYDVHICTVDEHPDKKPCGDIDRCREAADDDLAQLRDKNADISINDGKEQPITTNFKDHEIKARPFQLRVASENDLSREPKYHLGPGNYDGVAHGTYILMNNLKAGKYILKFGGKAGNYKTRSKYTINVT